MRSEELTAVMNSLSGFTDCIQTCFNIYNGNRVFYTNGSDIPYIDVTKFIKEIYDFLWEETYNEKYSSNSTGSLLDSDVFKKFLTEYNYENNKIIVYISTSKIIDGNRAEVIEEDITSFIKIAFSSIRKYVQDKLYRLSEDGIRDFILKNLTK